MAVPNHSIISVAELKGHLNAGGAEQAANLELACTIASAAIEARVNRRIVSRGSITEYHTIRASEQLEELYVSQWPIATITTLHEDETWPRAYGAGSLLVAGTDYEIVGPDRIRRLASSGGWPSWWKVGTRIVRNVFVAGYQGLDGTPTALNGGQALPYDLKQAALFVAASIFKEADRQRWGVSAVTDATGNYTRFLGYFTPAIDEMLAPYRRVEFHRTWELAA